MAAVSLEALVTRESDNGTSSAWKLDVVSSARLWRRLVEISIRGGGWGCARKAGGEMEVIGCSEVGGRGDGELGGGEKSR